MYKNVRRMYSWPNSSQTWELAFSALSDSEKLEYVTNCAEKLRLLRKVILDKSTTNEIIEASEEELETPSLETLNHAINTMVILAAGRDFITVATEP